MPNLILEELRNEGQNIRGSYKKRLPTDSSKDYYYLMRETKNLEPIIIEYGFITSENDDPYQIKNNWRNYAEGVVKALSKYLDFSYKPAFENNIYIVKAGDTIYGIARKYNINPADLLNANNLTSSNILQIGENLIIPSTNETTLEPETDLESGSIYIVKPQDTLYSIGNKFNISPNEIMKMNNLNSSIIQIGQKLVINKYNKEDYYPNENKDYINYKVIGGDSLYNLALKYNTTVDEIKILNNLYNDNLIIGQTLLLPNLESYTNSDYADSYSVKFGDTLYSIASKYDTTVDEIKQENNLTSNTIHPNQKLIIPSTNIYNTHTVSRGDTLYNIAQQYNVTVDYLKELNNLSTDFLSIGQTLKI